MSILDKVLEPYNVKYDDLNSVERETLNTLVEAVKKNQVTIAKFRESIARMKAGVEQDISKEPTFIRIFIFKVENPQLIRLQARLRNYLLIEAFLSTPEEAQKQLEQAVVNLAPSKT